MVVCADVGVLGLGGVCVLREWGCVCSATTESGGAFSGSLDTTGCPNGTDSIYAVASWTDAFGNAHSWTSPATSVSVQNTPPPPSISIEYGGNTEFSPNGDGQEDTATVGFCLSDEANVTATVTNGAGTTVRTLESSQDTVTPAWCSPYNGGQAQLTWDGTSDSGATVPDGSYTLRIHAVDAYSQSGDATTDFDVDTQPPGTLTTPSSGASLTGSASWSFAPTSGFSVSAVYVYCGSGAASASATTESGGAFSGSLDTTGCPNGTDSIYAVASWTDAFGNAHSWTSPATSVSVQNTPPPPSISIEYGGNTEFSPNGDGRGGHRDRRLLPV